jgi:signal transduction histidine kinase
MKVTWKLTIALAATVLAVLSVNSVMRVQRETEVFEDDLEGDHRVLGRAVAGAAALVYRNGGADQALEVVEDANLRENELSIRWVWLDLPAGDRRGPTAAITDLSPGQPRAIRGPGADGTKALYTYVGMNLPGARTAAIEIRESLAPQKVYVDNAIRSAVEAMLLMVLVCAVLVMVLGVAFVGRPVGALVAQARRIGLGDLATRLRPKRRDELGELALEMDAMCDRLAQARDNLAAETEARIAAIEQLRHADRLTTVGKLAAGVAHEMGTPLNVITGHAQLIGDEYPKDTTAHQSAQVIGAQARRLATIIRQLLDFARRRSPETDRQDLRPLTRQTVALLGALAHRHSVALELVEPAEPIECNVDAGQYQQALTNLIVNGIQSMGQGGALRITLGQGRDRPPADAGGREALHARVMVEDEGSGIAPDAMPRIFEPFFTTKDVGEGTGLGLSVTYGIVREHGGWIDVEPRTPGGSRFVVHLPMVAP